MAFLRTGAGGALVDGTNITSPAVDRRGGGQALLPLSAPN